MECINLSQAKKEDHKRTFTDAGISKFIKRNNIGYSNNTF